MPLLSSKGGGAASAFGITGLGLPPEYEVQFTVTAGGAGGGGDIAGGSVQQY